MTRRKKECHLSEPTPRRSAWTSPRQCRNGSRRAFSTLSSRAELVLCPAAEVRRCRDFSFRLRWPARVRRSGRAGDPCPRDFLRRGGRPHLCHLCLEPARSVSCLGCSLRGHGGGGGGAPPHDRGVSPPPRQDDPASKARVCARPLYPASRLAGSRPAAGPTRMSAVQKLPIRSHDRGRRRMVTILGSGPRPHASTCASRR